MRIKNTFIRAKSKLSALFLGCVTAAVCAFPAFAAEGDSASSVITGAITSQATSLQSDAISMIGSIAPYALGIVGAFLLFKLGKKFFSQVGK